MSDPRKLAAILTAKVRYGPRASGCQLWHLGRFDEARAAWQEVLQVNPATPWNTVAKCALQKNPEDFE